MDEMEKKGPESNFLGSISPKKGHRLFQLNTETGEVTEAHVEGKLVEMPDGRKEIRKQVFIREKYLYISALNKKNAIKRFARMAQMINNENTQSDETIGEDDQD
jgi:Uma2 family endonuclease